MDRYTLLLIRAFFHFSQSTPTCRLPLARRSATRSNRQTFFNRAGYIQRRCHIASRSAVGYRQSYRFWYHRFNAHTRHRALEEQTAMEALVRNVVKFLVLALIHMHGSTKGASHNLVHQLSLGTATSLKGTATSFSLHTTLNKTRMLHRRCRPQAFFAWTYLPLPLALGQSQRI